MNILFFLPLLAALVLSACSEMPTGLGGHEAPSAASSKPALATDEITQCADQVKKLPPQDRPSSSLKPSVDLLYWCTKAAEKGDARSQFVLARLYEKGTFGPANQPEAIRWYKASASSGFADAQFKIGQIYGRGEGVPIDKAEATRWYLKAAGQGHLEAMYYMGYRYEHGKGTPKDFTEAFKWYGLAAEHGNRQAMAGLGSLYLLGHGVPQNQVEAYKWFNLAAVSGDKDPIAQRDKLARTLSKSQLAEGQHLASEWAKKHPLDKKP
ncbi:MAG: sel1 repeat family protein [Gammaproteobacteria bacterium]|nr:sel1 repeat family protein [Gammaproteobacteria bacterium]